MLTLLPPSATDFEHRAEEAIRFDALPDAIAAIPGIKSTVPEPFAAWLAAEWFLADFARYFPSASALIVAGLPWLRQRGTAAAVARALSWIEFAASIEEDGARLHLDPGTPAAPKHLAEIRHIVVRSIPAHCAFYRMFHGHDVRHIRLDRSRLDAATLDDDSGVVVAGVKLSFGTFATLTADDPESDPALGSAALIYSAQIWSDDGWRLDAWRLDSEVVIDASGGVTSQTSQTLPDIDAAGPAVLGRCDVISTAAGPGEDPAPTAFRLDSAGATLADDNVLRQWIGPWSGPWREPIPHTLTQMEF